MPVEIAKLLVRPKPKPGESIIGYLLRLAEANGYEATPWLLRAFKLRKTNARHSYVYGMTDMRLLAESTCAAQTVLEQMTFRPVGVHSSRLIGNYEAFGQIVPSFVIRPNDPKICPKCLAEEAFCRKAWELAVLTACPEHS
jgi:hypothetical protein